MTNKPMLSVERELLEQAVAREPVRPRLEGRNNTCIGCGNWMPYGHREAHEHEEGCLEEISAENRHWVTQLRAILDKEVDGNSRSHKQQGEPVAMKCLRQIMLACAEGKILGYVSNLAEDALEAEKSAPVAAVMPERMHIPAAHCPERINAQGWNACLDAYARLNRMKP